MTIRSLLLHIFIGSSIMCICGNSYAAPKTVALADVALEHVIQGHGKPGKDTSIEGTPISIGGKKYSFGLGTHAESFIELELNGAAERFTAMVGVDDEVEEGGSVAFEVYADGKQVHSSGVVRRGDPAKKVDVDLSGVKRVILVVNDGGDGNGYDHADWAEAQFTVSGDPAQIIPAPLEEPYILTPPTPPTPRINGPKAYGVRPGSPFMYTIPATGKRPIIFSAVNLPSGLSLNIRSGLITGVVKEKGEYPVSLHAKNALGETNRQFKIVVGDAICLTPPLGWNSWNVWGLKIDDQKVRDCADAFVTSGLINHGWQYINIDDGWQGKRTPPTYALQANEKFPDMKNLCDYVHDLGLKIGIYSTPWKRSYGGYPGGSTDTEDGRITNRSRRVGAVRCETRDAWQYARWGIDYLKYDWHVIDVNNTTLMLNALKASGRDIAYSLSNSAPFDNVNEWVRLANVWRTTGDIRDTWTSMSRIGFDQNKWSPFAGPGHWNDPDMLVVGLVGWGDPHPSRLTANEQYTHISLWCLLSAPLLLGNDMTKLDDFTISLLSNDEVLEVNQDPMGNQASQVSLDDKKEVWAKTMEDGSKAVGLFNRGLFSTEVTVKWSDLGIAGKQTIRDLWRQKDLGTFEEEFKAEVPRHGVLLIRVSPAK